MQRFTGGDHAETDPESLVGPLLWAADTGGWLLRAPLATTEVERSLVLDRRPAPVPSKSKRTCTTYARRASVIRRSAGT